MLFKFSDFDKFEKARFALSEVGVDFYKSVKKNEIIIPDDQNLTVMLNYEEMDYIEVKNLLNLFDNPLTPQKLTAIKELSENDYINIFWYLANY